ncbi:MAG: MFS transporter [Defluviimonas sp.]|uniref:MFS transporter n=1 Tax=Albidovulum sp. TaxID=1872424 RepID=UPI001D80ECBF|nr:MFS transporter [Paracoccaceae bacterium]MCC0064224.1 MFS transporter [Defluviimonas sp.]
MAGTRWGLIAALWFAGLTAAGQFAKTAVIIDLLRPVWPGAGVWLGLVVSVVGFVGILFGTTAGIAVARIGPRRMLLAALVVGAALSLAESLMPPLAVMIVLRALEGMSHLAIVVAAPVLIAASARPEDQPAAMTLWSTFFAVAFAITAFVGRPLVAASGPAALFLCHAALMAGAALLLSVLLAKSERVPRDAIAGAGLIEAHRRIYASPRIAAPALGFVFYTLMFVAFLTLLPDLIAPEWRLLTATVMPLVSIVVSLGLGVALTRARGAVLTVQVGLGATALVIALLVASAGQGVMALVAVMAISGALGLVQGGSFAAISELNDAGPARAEAAGAIAQLGNVGTTLGTPVLLRMTDLWGLPAVLWFGLPLCLGGIATHGWLARRRARQPSG